MSEANVVFALDEDNLTIQCSTEDKMKDICQKYSTKINKNINTLLFLYGENRVNFELSFEELANSIDRNNHEMKISVYEFNCSKYSNKININNEKLNEIILSNDGIKDTINSIKLQIDNIINISSTNSWNIQLKNINKMLNLIIEEINKNNERIKNLFDDFNKINKNITILNTNKTLTNSENNMCLKNENLLENIKSKYISKIIFSHLDEKIKLKIIKYNKKLQNKINLGLIINFTAENLLYMKQI